MTDHEKSRDELLAELQSLKEKIADLESFKRDQEHIELELRKSREVLDMLIGNIPNQVFWKSRELVYLGCNKTFAQVTGMDTPSAVIGKTDYDFHRDSAHAESYREWDKKIMDSGKPILNIEEKYHNSDGSEGTVLTSKVPLRAPDGEIFGILGICTDITELKEALAKVKILGGLLPICANCKKVRDDRGYWNQIELFLREHSEAEFSHSICPDCLHLLYPDFIDENKKKSS